jgi:hypothetical protein
MKNKLIILLSGLFLCGCSQKQASSVGPAIDLVQAGKNISWRDGYVLHITKRDGSSLEGITLSGMFPNGLKLTMTADTGTVTPVVAANVTNDSSVMITLHNAKAQAGSESSAMPEGDFPIVLQKN